MAQKIIDLSDLAVPASKEIDLSDLAVTPERTAPPAPSPATLAILAAQRKNYPTAGEMGGVPGTAMQAPTVAQSVFNTEPNAASGMNSPEVALLSAAVPGAAATEGMGIGAAAAESPAMQAIRAVRNKFPNLTSAGSKFDQVMAAAKDVPIDTAPANEVLARAQELRQRGSSFPKVMNDFAKAQKAGAASAEPFSNLMTYKEGRDFASSAGALSTREATAMNATMQRQVGEFAQALKTANREAAVKVGMGDLYDSAMKEYRQAKTIQGAGEVLKKHAWQAALTAGGVTYAGKVIREVFGK